MRGKTRNLLENVVAFVIFGLVLYGIYLIIINYTDIGKKIDIELPQKVIEKIAQKEEKIEELIDENILDLDNEDENKQENRFEIKPLKEKANEDKKEEIKETTIEKNEVEEEIKPQAKKDSQTPVSNKVEAVEPKVQKTETKPKASKQETKIKEEPEVSQPNEVETQEPKKEEDTSTKEPEEETQKEAKQPVLTDELIREKFALINNFLRTTKNKINEKVDALDIPKTQTPRYANVRITVLKDGNYEQLTFMDGDAEYFEQITPGIISAFPVSLDERIDDQFPRYFRMKITQER